MRPRRFPISFWSLMLLLALFLTMTAACMIAGLIHDDGGAGVCVLYGTLLATWIVIIGAPLAFLADVVWSRWRRGTWPWAPLQPPRPDL
jgi:hypothetical protein